MELLGLFFKLLKSSLSVDVYGIFRIFANVEAGLECLRRSHKALADAFQTHVAAKPRS